MHIVIHTDGGARGNPGPAAIGAVIVSCLCTDTSHGKNQQTLLHTISKTIGESTNNVAEYRAIIDSWHWLSKNSLKDIECIYFYLDSLLVVSQINGVYKIKDAKLRMLLMEIRMLEQSIKLPLIYTHIPRDNNFDADALVNNALDNNL